MRMVVVVWMLFIERLELVDTLPAWCMDHPPESSQQSTLGNWHCVHSTDEQTEAQEWTAVCPRAHSNQVGVCVYTPLGFVFVPVVRCVWPREA